MTPLARQYFEQLDKHDQLAPMREKFCLEKGLIYLDGNSLGVLPKATASHISQVITQQWGEGLIRSWNTHQWMQKPTELGDKVAQLVGSKKGQVLVFDTTSINIFKLTAAADKLLGRKRPSFQNSPNC